MIMLKGSYNESPMMPKIKHHFKEIYSDKKINLYASC